MKEVKLPVKYTKTKDPSIELGDRGKDRYGRGYRYVYKVSDKEVYHRTP